MKQEARFSGLFYPKDPEELRATINYLYEKVTVTSSQNVTGLISPHAGYVYSGIQAAEACIHIKEKKPKLCVIIGPSHRYSFNGASVLDKDVYQTPLGDVFIDQECVKKCVERHAYMSSIVQAYEHEHSIEVILPFLQVIQPDIQILPIVMGSYSMDSLCGISDTLATICDPDETIIISSTDFSHFYEAAVAEKMDQKAISLLQTMDIEQLYEQNQKENIQLCGMGPTLVMMLCLQAWGVATAEFLSHTHSGHVSGDMNSVVGYTSFRFY